MKKLACVFAAFVLLIVTALFAWHARPTRPLPEPNPFPQPSREVALRQAEARKILSENANWETGPRQPKPPAQEDW